MKMIDTLSKAHGQVGRKAEEAVDNVKNEFVFVKPVRAAKLLDMSKSKIYEMIQRNEIPSVRLGGCLRIPMSALDDLVAKANIGQQ